MALLQKISDRRGNSGFLIILALATVLAYALGRLHAPSLTANSAIGPESAMVATTAMPGTMECQTREEQFVTKLKETVHGNWFEKFASPVSSALQATFLQMAQKSGTDKVSTHEYQWHYTRHLSHARYSENFAMLEIGLGCTMAYGPGASLRLWRAFFPCASSRISFIEADAECANKRKDAIEKEAGGKLYIGSQADPVLLQSIVDDAKTTGGLDLIVDDGSHDSYHQNTSLIHLWPALKPGGVYIIEDLGTYWFVPEKLEPGSNSKPPIPLLTHLTEVIQCRAVHYLNVDEATKQWCINLVKSSPLSDVFAVDQMPEAIALVKAYRPAGDKQQ